jgi:hypothetical protein
MANQGVPVIERKVTAQETATPDFQSSTQKYAEATNSLSAIGAQVAQSSSNQLAAQLGYEEGKKPHGSLMPSITEFDKTFADSYHTQSQATLGLAGDKLLSDAQVTMAQANRLTPDLIDKTHKELQIGLQKLTEQAPLEVKGKLEQAFSAQLLHQTNQYKEKMITQQREDQANLIKNGIDLNIKNATELALSGDYQSAAKARDTAISIAQSGYSGRYITPETARVSKETAQQAYYNGIWSHQAKIAYEQNRLPAFMKEYGSDLHGMTNEQHMAAGQAITQQVSFMKQMRSEYENINVVQFQQQIAENVNAISSNEITALKSKVSPLQYEQLQLEYIKRKRTFNEENQGANNIIEGFTDKNIFPRATTTQKNKAFDSQVLSYMQSMQKQGKPIDINKAQAFVATTAAGAIPGYVDVLNAKLASTNPVDIETAGRSISYITQRGKGANLDGLNDKSIAMYEMYQSLRRSKIPQEAAQEAYNAVYPPKTEENKRILDDNWNDNIKTIKSDTGKLKYFTELGGIDSDDLVDRNGYIEQAESLLRANYILTNGDLDTAKKITSDAIKNTYGTSYVNGKKQTTFYPLENAVGIPSDGVAFIQEDIIEFANKELASTKAAFDAGALPYYYEVEPRQGTDSKHANTVLQKYFTEGSYLERKLQEGSEIIIHKHWKNGTRETYPLIVKADPWLSKTPNPKKPYTGGWDIVLGTENGYIPINRENPMLDNFLVYRPDIEKIKAKYLSKNGLKG